MTVGKWCKGVLVGTLFLLLLTGCSDSLEPWEEDAVQFLRYSHMKTDPEKLRPYMSYPEKAETYDTFRDTVKPGTVWVNSKSSGQRSYEVVIYFPEHPEQSKFGDYVEMTAWKHGEKWKISHIRFRVSSTTDFDHFKEKMKEKGLTTEQWKSYELN
ncbi:hypothetical protein [Kroppenstedtia sanguinis]|uniref:DUF4829 domain-containing protein n=1 Tax=Kroppenstedtia sanguinis TaxID=1380684 RepID=A0ABW4CCH0_9BACL